MIVLALAMQSAILSPPIPADRQSVTVPQLSADPSPGTRISQVARDGGSARSVQTQRIAGHDRCERPAYKGDAVCRRPIEARATQYGKVDPTPLDRDQRAIAERRLVDPRSDMPTTEQRIARGELDPDTPMAQGIASTAINRPTPGGDPAETGLTDLQRAIISGVIVPGDLAPTVIPR